MASRRKKRAMATQARRTAANQIKSGHIYSTVVDIEKIPGTSPARGETSPEADSVQTQRDPDLVQTRRDPDEGCKEPPPQKVEANEVLSMEPFLSSVDSEAERAIEQQKRNMWRERREGYTPTFSTKEKFEPVSEFGRALANAKEVPRGNLLPSWNKQRRESWREPEDIQDMRDLKNADGYTAKMAVLGLKPEDLALRTKHGLLTDDSAPLAVKCEYDRYHSYLTRCDQIQRELQISDEHLQHCQQKLVRGLRKGAQDTERHQKRRVLTIAQRLQKQDKYGTDQLQQEEIEKVSKQAGKIEMEITSQDEIDSFEAKRSEKWRLKCSKLYEDSKQSPKQLQLRQNPTLFELASPPEVISELAETQIAISAQRMQKEANKAVMESIYSNTNRGISLTCDARAGKLQSVANGFKNHYYRYICQLDRYSKLAAKIEFDWLHKTLDNIAGLIYYHFHKEQRDNARTVCDDIKERLDQFDSSEIEPMLSALTLLYQFSPHFDDYAYEWEKVREDKLVLEALSNQSPQPSGRHEAVLQTVRKSVEQRKIAAKLRHAQYGPIVRTKLEQHFQTTTPDLNSSRVCGAGVDMFSKLEFSFQQQCAETLSSNNFKENSDSTAFKKTRPDTPRPPQHSTPNLSIDSSSQASSDLLQITSENTESQNAQELIPNDSTSIEVCSSSSESEYATARVQFTPSKSICAGKAVNTTIKHNNNSEEYSFMALDGGGNNTGAINKIKETCSLCYKQHKLKHCEMFQAANPRKRQEMIKQEKRCFKCFSPSHLLLDCKSKTVCIHCGHEHNSLLHGAHKKHKLFAAIWENREQKQVSSSHLATHKRQPVAAAISLRIVPVIISTKAGLKWETHALVDDGTSSSMIAETIANHLDLTGHQQDFIINGIGGTKQQFRSCITSYTVTAADGSFSKKMRTKVIPNPTGSLLPVDWNQLKVNHKHLTDINFPNIFPGKEVGLVIGNDYPTLSQSLEERPGLNDSEPSARRLHFGWTAVGQTSKVDEEISYLAEQRTLKEKMYSRALKAKYRSPLTVVSYGFMADKADSDLELNKLMTKLYSTEQLPDQWDTDEMAMSKDERAAMDVLNVTRTKLEVGYQYGVLWRDNEPQLPYNYETALNRLRRSENSKIMQDPKVREEYNKVFQGYIDKGYLIEVEHATSDMKVNYLSHFPVVRWDKTSSQVRPVLDGAAKTNGKSLNDAILKGPSFLNLLVNVLLRLRKNRVAVIGDVSQMYLRVHLPEEDQDYHRILWRAKKSEQIKEYKFCVHCFGNCGSACVAIHCVKTHAKEHAHRYPRAAECVQLSTVVDDNLDSVDTIEDAIKLIADLKLLFSECDMVIKKFCSNESRALEGLESSEIAKSIDISGMPSQTADHMPATKTLGVIWLPQPDMFRFVMDRPEPTIWTKRKLASEYAKLYDPLGMLIPFVIIARNITQDCWRQGMTWDEPVPQELLGPWEQWLDSLKDLQHIGITRCLQGADQTKVVERQEVHIFSDASKLAYATVAYMLNFYTDGTKSTVFIMARARVAPLKYHTIPKLELMGAHLSILMARQINATLQLNKKDYHYWTDSTNVLSWIETSSRTLITFVANRVAQIQEGSFIPNWHWVGTAENPADLASRGVLAEVLQNSSIWWTGPQFLLGNTNNYPKRVAAESAADIQDGVRKSQQSKFSNDPKAVTFAHLANNLDLYSNDNEKGSTVQDELVDDVYDDLPLDTRFQDFGFHANSSPGQIRSGDRDGDSANEIDETSEEESEIADASQDELEVLIRREDEQQKKEIHLGAAPLQDKYLTTVDNEVYHPSNCSSLKQAMIIPLCFARWKHYKNRRLQVTKTKVREEATDILLKQAQRESLALTIDQLGETDNVAPANPNKRLRPRIQPDTGLVRVYSRLRAAKYLDPAARCPVLLHKTHPLTRLMIKDIHENELRHVGGQNHIMSVLNTRFWITGARTIVSRVLRSCIKCRRAKAHPIHQEMCPLSNKRITTASTRLSAFTHAAMDCAGPFWIKQHSFLEEVVETSPTTGIATKKQCLREPPPIKRYMLLITCMSYRAVHLEPLSDMTTDAFMLAFNRFLARRQRPISVTSDNGKNFIGANNELKRLWQEGVDEDEIIRKYPKIEWCFTPPYTPHQGGVFERMIKSAKAALTKVTPINEIDDEQFATSLAMAEGLVNMRPISYISKDSDDLEPITPAHFLSGPANFDLAPVDGATKISEKWAYQERLADQFWQRFIKEVIPKLQTFYKWHKTRPDLKENDVVVVLDEKVRGNYPLGRIMKIYPSLLDGHTRRADVYYDNGAGYDTKQRPFHQLYPLLEQHDILLAFDA